MPGRAPGMELHLYEAVSGVREQTGKVHSGEQIPGHKKRSSQLMADHFILIVLYTKQPIKSIA